MHNLQKFMTFRSAQPLIRSLALGVVVSCGVDSESDSSPSPGNGSENKDAFTLTGNEATKIKGDQVKDFVKQIAPGFATKYISSSFIAAGTIESMASGVSRDLTAPSSFKSCIKTKIALVPVQKTRDTVSYSFEFDFIKECDREAKPEDLVGEIRNKMKVSATFGCASDKFRELKVVYLKDLPANLDALCEGEVLSSRKLAFEAFLDEHKSFLVKKDGVLEVDQISRKESRNYLGAKNGSPCSIVRTSLTSEVIDSCRMILESNQFLGKAEDDKNSPNDELKNHPIVTQKVVTVGNAVLEAGATHYTSADTTFRYNGWEGAFKYTNGYVAPSWEATFDSEVLKGIVGE